MGTPFRDCCYLGEGQVRGQSDPFVPQQLLFFICQEQMMSAGQLQGVAEGEWGQGHLPPKLKLPLCPNLLSGEGFLSALSDKVRSEQKGHSGRFHGKPKSLPEAEEGE